MNVYVHVCCTLVHACAPTYVHADELCEQSCEPGWVDEVEPVEAVKRVVVVQHDASLDEELSGCSGQ